AGESVASNILRASSAGSATTTKKRGTIHRDPAAACWLSRGIALIPLNDGWWVIAMMSCRSLALNVASAVPYRADRARVYLVRCFDLVCAPALSRRCLQAACKGRANTEQ